MRVLVFAVEPVGSCQQSVDLRIGDVAFALPLLVLVQNVSEQLHGQLVLLQGVVDCAQVAVYQNVAVVVQSAVQVLFCDGSKTAGGEGSSGNVRARTSVSLGGSWKAFWMAGGMRARRLKSADGLDLGGGRQAAEERVVREGAAGCVLCVKVAGFCVLVLLAREKDVSELVEALDGVKVVVELQDGPELCEEFGVALRALDGESELHDLQPGENCSEVVLSVDGLHDCVDALGVLLGLLRIAGLEVDVFDFLVALQRVSVRFALAVLEDQYRVEVVRDRLFELFHLAEAVRDVHVRPTDGHVLVSQHLLLVLENLAEVLVRLFVRTASEQQIPLALERIKEQLLAVPDGTLLFPDDLQLL